MCKNIIEKANTTFFSGSELLLQPSLSRVKYWYPHEHFINVEDLS